MKTTSPRLILPIMLLILTLNACGQSPAEAVPQADVDTGTANVAVDGGGNNSDSAPDGISTPSASPEADAPPGPLSMEADMGMAVGGRWFPIWQDAAELLAALGDDYEMAAAPSCVFEGEDKEFAYDGFFVFTNPDGNKDIWYSIYLADDTLETARGIRVGDSLAAVMAAYGEGYYWEGDSILTYSVSGLEGDIESPCIQFGIEEDVVVTIEIYYPTNVT